MYKYFVIVLLLVTFLLPARMKWSSTTIDYFFDTNFKSAEASQNKAEAAAKSATEVFRSSEKLNNEFEKVEQELHEMDKKEEN